MKNNMYGAIGLFYVVLGVIGAVIIKLFEFSTGSFWDDVALNVYWMLALVIGFTLALTADYKNKHQIGDFTVSTKYGKD